MLHLVEPGVDSGAPAHLARRSRAPAAPELLPGVPHFTFTLLRVPFTVAWPNLVAWIVVVAAVVAGAWARLPRWIG